MASNKKHKLKIVDPSNGEKPPENVGEMVHMCYTNGEGYRRAEINAPPDMVCYTLTPFEGEQDFANHDELIDALVAGHEGRWTSIGSRELVGNLVILLLNNYGDELGITYHVTCPSERTLRITKRYVEVGA